MPPGLDRDQLILGGVSVLVVAFLVQLVLARGGGTEVHTLGRFDLPLGFEEIPGTGGLSYITDLANAGDGSGRLFVVEQPGTVRVLRDGILDAEPFIDLTDRVLMDGPEQGLLGIAISPEFARDGTVYLYSTGLDGGGVLSRFRLDAAGAVLDPGSEEVLFSVEKGTMWHYGGDLLFGPDGALYFATGDDATGGAAQDPTNPLGKLWRLDVSQPGATPEQIARGLRNPWRIAYDPPSGNLFIADVGQWSWEEVNVTRLDARGTNFGWDVFEGSFCYADICSAGGDVADPVAVYGHTEGENVAQCAVVGGQVARTPAMPSFDGVYLFADHCSGWFFGMRQGTDGGWEWGVIGEGGGGWPLYPTTFGLDEDGTMYVGTIAGEIYRVRER